MGFPPSDYHPTSTPPTVCHSNRYKPFELMENHSTPPVRAYRTPRKDQVRDGSVCDALAVCQCLLEALAEGYRLNNHSPAAGPSPYPPSGGPLGQKGCGYEKKGTAGITCLG